MGGRGLLIVYSSPTSLHSAADPSPLLGLWPLPTLLPRASTLRTVLSERQCHWITLSAIQIQPV